MTDNRVWVDEDGRETVACSRGDSLGLELLANAGIEAMVLSMERNPVVARRCEKLGIGCKQGESDKLSALREILTEKNVEADEVVYVGNDVNDLECMRFVGCSFAPADAHAEVKSKVDCVLTQFGGRGAVREVCDMLIAHVEAEKGGRN